MRSRTGAASRLHALGWKAQHSLEEGVRKAYECFLQKQIRK
jgi:nucleoside-diphosphate-sugar epimerase